VVHTNDTLLELSAALTVNDRTHAIANGHVRPEGIRLLTTSVHASEMFWRLLKYAEFDVSEMSLSSLLIAASNGPTDWVAIPVYTMRHFFHTSVLVRDGAGINVPADLHGKRVGVPEYQQTWAVWSRGTLKDQYGVDPREVTWFMERSPAQSHGGATGFTPPTGVEMHYIPQASNIGAMMLAGELDATLLYLRSDGNLIDRSTADLEKRAGYPHAVS
jgi:4,5-dihydroxyphthalate decarboxylase